MRDIKPYLNLQVVWTPEDGDNIDQEIEADYGGLVVLQTILDGRLQPSKYPGIYNCIVGLAFFGTPFRGTDSIFHTKMLQHAEMMQMSVYHENYKIFEPCNDSLLNVVDSFLETTGDGDLKPRTICFYETKRTDVGRLIRHAGDADTNEDKNLVTILVNSHSGRLDPNKSTDYWSRACDHFDVNKFSNPDDGDFERLVDELKTMIKDGPGMIHQRSQGMSRPRAKGRHSVSSFESNRH
ncbi:hypothetical protein N8I77_009458 [Diaporthe amygdali]|uniref:Uncharacterized protein n=1 Tax=Phomopsis amygdali TaxID=1214568 RepID=A0AAD9S9U1_PHOAM|nr:hypothetical protein N8I77_009458 [Diaporthe amygdali]